MFKWLYGPFLSPKADRLGTYAAALAYCFVLSLVPFLALTFAVGSEISSRLDQEKHYKEHYAEVVGDIIPTKDAQQIFTAVQGSTKGGLVTIGFILAIYASFNLMDQIIRTILFIFDDLRRPSEWSWKVVVKGFALLMIWMSLLLLISISAVETAMLRHLLDEHFELTTLSDAVAKGLQVTIVIGALFGTFYLTYFMVPTKTPKHKFLVEGSMMASCGWIVSSLLFAYVMPKILQSSAAYIALGSVVAILFWAQACAWSIIVGACWIVRFSPRSK